MAERYQGGDAVSAGAGITLTEFGVLAGLIELVIRTISKNDDEDLNEAATASLDQAEQVLEVAIEDAREGMHHARGLVMQRPGHDSRGTLSQ